MKRTNLVLDEDLLKTATRLIGAKTYSATVNQALRETIRSYTARGLSGFLGKGVWSGSLSEMRQDSGPKGRKKGR